MIVSMLEELLEPLMVELLLAEVELASREVFWLEVAVLPHPANPRAITEARSMNFGVLFIFFSFYCF